MNARAIATLGISFGALAVSTIGLLTSSVPPVQPEYSDAYHGGAARHIHRHNDDTEVMELLSIVLASGIFEE